MNAIFVKTLIRLIKGCKKTYNFINKYFREWSFGNVVVWWWIIEWEQKTKFISSQEQYLFCSKRDSRITYDPNEGSELQEKLGLAKKLKPMEAQAFFER